MHPTSLVSWRERGVFPGTEGEEGSLEVIFQDVFKADQTQTLLESIEAGLSVIYLELGVDNKGGTLKIPYYSYRLSKGCLFYKRGEQK